MAERLRSRLLGRSGELRRPAGAGLVAGAALVAAAFVWALWTGLAGAAAPAKAPGAAQAPPQGIRVEDPWARPAKAMGGHADASMGMTSAIFLTLVNDSGTTRYLVAAKSDVADAVELHETRIVDNVMKMQPVARIEVPAKGRAQLKPGGYHIMLLGLRRTLAQGDRFQATLVFDDGSELAVDVPVEMR
ncbi:MAG: copper chaperone PCu(A)C [Limnochordaceae bacterium]|nr:copper chaperone PCu(A)C [Limnochordaceae bacterium]